MSETTKRTSHLTPFYLPSPDMADSAERDLWERLHRDVPPRPSTFAAEGYAERETTNLPAEIGGVCTGRKVVLDLRWLCLVFVVAIIAGIWKAAGFWAAVEAVLAVWWWDMFRNWRASGGEGV